MRESMEKFDTWGVLEVMGHKRYAGRITEQTIAGAALVRVDVPPAVDSHGQLVAEYSKMFGVGSVYCLTPTTEAVARRVAEQLARWENANPFAAGAGETVDVAEHEFEDEFDEDDWDDGAEQFEEQKARG